MLVEYIYCKFIFKHLRYCSKLRQQNGERGNLLRLAVFGAPSDAMFLAMTVENDRSKLYAPLT